MKYTRKNNGVTARPSARLLDQVRDRLRVRHYSLRTEQACLSWMRRFILASGSIPQRTAYRSASLSDEIPSVHNLE
ncbi:integrase [Xanthomonas campestris]|uniref:integrase n=1 Tax=Xanthomonas campestris TaxID=339 RepID=UPI000E7225E2|nr:integrase [Xanthomonas campestris]RJU10912.1 integrase [Xanthomonas campestris]